jgi:hypothetical protein
VASSDITFIRTGSITPRQSPYHHCMQTGGKTPLPKLPQYPVHTRRGGLQICLDALKNFDFVQYGATIPQFYSPQPSHEGPTPGQETTYSLGSRNVFRDLQGGGV